MPANKNRTWNVSNLTDVPALANKLAGPEAPSTWTLCTGFRVPTSDPTCTMVLLNDAFTEDSAQEYAVVLELSGAGHFQVESLTVSWMEHANLLTYLQEIAGDPKAQLDNSWSHELTRLRMESNEDHGRCRLCA